MLRRSLDDVLEECLRRMARGEGIEECFQDYPREAEELRPLLEVAWEVIYASRQVPRASFRREAEGRFRAAVAARGMARLSFWRRLSWAAAVAILILAGGGGVVAASGGSLPGEPLYPVKTSTEEMRMFLAPGALDKARLQAYFAEARAAEMARMAERGRDEEVAPLLLRLAWHWYQQERFVRLTDWQVKEMKDLVALEGNLAASEARQEAVLKGILERSPLRARVALEHAIRVSRRGQLSSLAVLEGVRKVRGFPPSISFPPSPEEPVAGGRGDEPGLRLEWRGILQEKDPQGRLVISGLALDVEGAQIEPGLTLGHLVQAQVVFRRGEVVAVSIKGLDQRSESGR